MQVSHYLYLYVGDDVSWACAALVRLLREHHSGQSLDSEWDLLPSYLRYGVSTPSGLLLALAGMDDRDTINSITSESPVSTNVQQGWLRQIGWVLSIAPDIHPQITRIQTDLINRIGPFRIPAVAESRIYGIVDVQPDGRMYIDGRPVGSISSDFVPLVTRLKGRATFELTYREEQPFLEVNPTTRAPF